MPRSEKAVNRATRIGPEKPGLPLGGISLVPGPGLERLGPDLFRASQPDAWLRIATLGPVPVERWIRLRYRTDQASDPVRPLLRMVYQDGRSEIDIMAGPVCGAASWVTRVPLGVAALEICPFAGAGTVAFSLDELNVMGRWRLLMGAAWRKPGLTLTSLGLRLRGKRVRARHFIKSIWASTPFRSYPAWLAVRRGSALQAPSAHAPVREGKVTLIVDGRGASAAELDRTLASLAGQDPDALLVVAETRTELSPRSLSLPAAWATAGQGPGWVGVVAAGDVLAPHALAAMLTAAARQPAWTAIYSDEDQIDGASGRFAPRLKPDWSPRLQGGRPYVGGLLLVRASGLGEVPALERGRLESCLLDRALADPGVQVGHVRRILYHRRVGRGEAAASAEPLQASGAPATWPSVSVVIPNRDRLGLLKPCIEGLRDRTRYPDLEIVVVDNGSVEPETKAFYGSLGADPRIRLLDQPGPFNFSALCNAGVAVSRGEILLLLNNDIEVIGPDWLERMIAEAMRPEVGAVGAKLLYPDGRLQHGGVVIGLGGAAGHIHRGRPGDEGGWLDRLAVTHEVSAVTGACLAVSRAKYESVGGLDEELFPVSFNDIDLCMKLQAAGWTNLMVPAAVLFHHESASRGHDRQGAKQARAEREAAAFAAKWLPVMRDDPYFHPGLSLLRFDVSLG